MSAMKTMVPRELHSTPRSSAKQLYNASGSASEVAFDPASMLGQLSDNGGYTKTIALVGSSNPAVTGGLTAEQLSGIAEDTIVPVADRTLLAKDQRR